MWCWDPASVAVDGGVTALAPAGQLLLVAFREGSFLSFLRPSVNTKLMHTHTNTTTPSHPYPYPVDKLGIQRVPVPRLAFMGPALLFGVSKAVGLGPGPQNTVQCWRDSLLSLWDTRRAAVRSWTPRKGRGEKDCGTHSFPKALCTKSS